jgi:CBS domain-containing protein
VVVFDVVTLIPEVVIEEVAEVLRERHEPLTALPVPDRGICRRAGDDLQTLILRR